jgi:hypothetical protein
MKQPRPDRVALYRKRAGETRSEAGRMEDSQLRATMIEVADTWERLANQEEVSEPAPPDQTLPPVTPGEVPSPTGTDEAS